jgi:pimeloyl-ACP methyl ester carboxylesterase
LTSAHFLYTYTQALDMCRRIANAEVVMIPRSGHLLNLDNPEAFNSALEGFLERVAW